MHKTVVEEFDVCHKFVSNCVEYNLPPHERESGSISHLIGSEEFYIFVGYDKKNFGGRIKQFIDNIIKEAWKSEYELYHYHCFGVPLSKK